MADKKKKPELMPHAGGQAVIEGVLMRSKHFYAVAVRNNKGKLVIDRGPAGTAAVKYAFLKWPVVRGFMALVDSMTLGMKGLDFSARIFEEGEEKKSGKKPAKKEADREKERKKEDLINGLIMAGSFVIAILLFIYVPVLLTKLLAKAFQAVGNNGVLFNSIVVFFKFVLFFGYIWAISFMEDVKRLFMYHGAEHRAIYAYEEGKALTISNMSKYPVKHPRCGTAFMFITIIVSVIVFILLLPPHLGIVKRVLFELPLIPLIAGLSYEALKLSDKYRHNPVMKIFIAPGLAFQKLTTRIPDKKQMEVAAKALKIVVGMEKRFNPRSKTQDPKSSKKSINRKQTTFKRKKRK